MVSWVVYFDSGQQWISVGTYVSRWAAERAKENLQQFQREPLNITTMNQFKNNNKWEEENQRLRGRDVSGVFAKGPEFFLPERYLSDKELNEVIGSIDPLDPLTGTKKGKYQPMSKNVKQLIKDTGFPEIEKDEADSIINLKEMVMADDIHKFTKNIFEDLKYYERKDIKKFKDFLEDDKD